jgi:hypothetical protein
MMLVEMFWGEVGFALVEHVAAFPINKQLESGSFIS